MFTTFLGYVNMGLFKKSNVTEEPVIKKILYSENTLM